MLAEERFAIIVRMVEEKGTATVQELSEALQASESTIRRDLTHLDKLKKISKVHGGATAVKMDFTTKDAMLESRYKMNRDEKAMIARYAASLIETNDFVFVDGGTTTSLIVDYISEPNAVYVTNAMEHGLKLVRKGCQVVILGGELKPVTEATVGAHTLEELESLNFTKSFIGTNGVSLKSGYTTPDIHEAAVKRKAMEQSQQCFIVCDASKFHQVAPVGFGKYDDAVIITAGLEDENYKEQDNIIQVDQL